MSVAQSFDSDAGSPAAGDVTVDTEPFHHPGCLDGTLVVVAVRPSRCTSSNMVISPPSPPRRGARWEDGKEPRCVVVTA